MLVVSQQHTLDLSLGVDFAVVIFKRSVEKYFVLSGTPKEENSA